VYRIHHGPESVKNGLSATLDPPGADGADAFAVLSSRGDMIGESGVYLVGSARSAQQDVRRRLSAGGETDLLGD
jgi:hypothetical protein